MERVGGMALLTHQRSRTQRVDHPNALRVEPSENHLLVDVRDELFDLRGCQKGPAFDPPRFARGHAPGQLLHPLWGARDLDPAGLDEHAELLVLPDAVHGQRGHLL